jgi:uncharacterized membrane protein YGL010W
MLGGRSRDELMAQFELAHRNPWNRRLHLVSIPTLLASGMPWCLSPMVERL